MNRATLNSRPALSRLAVFRVSDVAGQIPIAFMAVVRAGIVKQMKHETMARYAIHAIRRIRDEGRRGAAHTG